MTSLYDDKLQQSSALADLYDVPVDRITELQSGLPGPVGYQLGYLNGRMVGVLADVARVHYEDCDRRDSCRTCTGLTEAVAVNLVSARVCVDDHLRAMLTPRRWWQVWKRHPMA